MAKIDSFSPLPLPLLEPPPGYCHRNPSNHQGKPGPTGGTENQRRHASAFRASWFYLTVPTDKEFFETESTVRICHPMTRL